VSDALDRTLNSLPALIGTSATPTVVALDASGKKVGYVFIAVEDDTITHLWAWASTITSPPVYRISLQSIDLSAGIPSGTILGGGSPASGTFTPVAGAQWVALANPIAVTAGSPYAIVIDYSSGTIAATTNTASFAVSMASLSEGRHGLPYTVQDATGSNWSKAGSLTNNICIFGYKSATHSYGLPVSGSKVSDSALASSGHRATLKLTMPAGHGASYKVSKIRATMLTGTTGGTWKVGIWDAAGTELASVTVDTDLVYNLNNERSISCPLPSASRPTLLFGTPYYFGVERVDRNISLINLDLLQNSDLSALPGGDGWFLATWNGSAWTEFQAQRPLIELALADWTAGGGGIAALTGGGLVR
jgi:hypothetical protein